MAAARVFCLFIAVAGLVIVVALAEGRSQSVQGHFHFDASTLKDKAMWTQVNAEPYRLSLAVDALCRAPIAEDYRETRRHNPHGASYITVYVNNLGREAMFTKENPRFPEGTVIVKEKMGSHPEPRKPRLYTVMRKREAGYNPAVGDWEFAVVGPNGSDLLALGKLVNCQSCHQGKRESDHVFRPYLKTTTNPN